MSDTLTRLAQVLEERKGAAADSSYVASLYHKGLNKILEKVGGGRARAFVGAGIPRAAPGVHSRPCNHGRTIDRASPIAPATT